ncbi:MAG: IPT/TIG domain-containing protein [Oscillochloridaceae bacterium umkhey_bin13]
MHETDERAFRSTIGSLTFPIAVPVPPPTTYHPLRDQRVPVAIELNGAETQRLSLAAPTVPYQRWSLSATAPTEQTVAHYGWAAIQVEGDLRSLEGLFPSLPERPGGQTVLVRFPSLGTFQFQSVKEDADPVRLTVQVTPYGEFGGEQRLIDPTLGGVLWAGGAAFEIPAGALPARSEGYQVSFSSGENNLILRDQPSERSPRYGFQITPEVTSLQRDLLLHLPAPTANGTPVMAFYDEVLQDACSIPSESDPTTPGYQLVRLPAGTYPLSTSQFQSASEGITPLASQGWLRRSLNWLGSTRVWNAVGLPNEKVENAYFSVLYNTRDGVSETYAQRLLDALMTSRTTLSGLGYPVPSSQVIVKIAPWATKITESDGFVPGIGTLGNWYMFFNDQLDDDELKATAAHEFFHIVQKETSTSARLIAPTWWMEGTAVWAEYAVFPSITSYQQRITTGGDFITKGLRNWNGSAESQYATVAFAIFLEDEYGAGTIKKVFEALGPLTGIEGALEQVTGKSLAEQIERFALVYFQQQQAPYRDWTIVNAISTYALAQASNDLFSRTPPALSAHLVRATYDPNKSPDAPISFTASDGSVARMMTGCTTMRAWMLDAQRQPIGMSFIGEPDPNQGQVLERLGDYRANNPLYALVVPGDQLCAIRLILETPTVTGISPASVIQGHAATITVYGQGFGPSEGLRVLAGGSSYSPSSFGPNSVSFTFPASAYPGTVSVRIQHKSGPISNPATLTITAP